MQTGLTMGHVFVCYSRPDSEYVNRLVEFLEQAGVNVWIDRGDIQPGARFRRTIQTAIDLCDAFVLVMSSSASQSNWIENELDWAEKRGKPIFALLLEGDPWFGLSATNFEDVSNLRPPSRRFLDALPETVFGSSDQAPEPPSTGRSPSALSELSYRVAHRDLTNSGALRYPDVNALIEILRGRGFVITPSDTCYALSALPLDRRVSERINLVLARNREPISLAFGAFKDVTGWANLAVEELRILEHLTPGPLTLVVKAQKGTPEHLLSDALDVSDETLGIRIPDSQVERQLAAELEQPLTTPAIRDADGSPVRDFSRAVEVVAAGMKRLPAGQRGLLAGIEVPAGSFLSQHSTVARVDYDGGRPSLFIKRLGSYDPMVIEQAMGRPSQAEHRDWR